MCIWCVFIAVSKSFKLSLQIRWLLFRAVRLSISSTAIRLFFAIHIPALCHRWWQPFLGAGAPVRSSALIAFQQAGQRLASHSTTLGAFQEHCAGIPLCRDLQSRGGTSKGTVKLGVDDYNPPGHRFTRLLNFKSGYDGILACTFARLGHKSCPINPGCMLGVLA